MFRALAWEGTASDPCVVDQDVEPPVFRIEIVVCSLVISLFRNIELDYVGIHPSRAEFANRLLSLRFVAGANDDLDVFCLVLSEV